MVDELPDVVPPDGLRLEGAVDCRGDGVVYRVEMVRLRQPTKRHDFSRLRVFSTQDNGVTWRSLPMRRALRSALLSHWCTWPPTNLVTVACNGTELSLTYFDEQIEEVPVLPFGLDQEALWQATFVKERQHWVLAVKQRLSGRDFSQLNRLLPKVPSINVTARSDGDQRRLWDLLGQRCANGYLNVATVTDAGVFELQRNDVKLLTECDYGDYSSLLPRGWADTAIEGIWTDDDTLFVLLEGSRCIVYEFVLPDAVGVTEAVRFVDNEVAIDRIRQYLTSDPDARRVVMPILQVP